MKWEEILSDSKLWKTVVKKILFVITFTVLLIFVLFHLDWMPAIGAKAVSVVGPFLIGIFIAFVLNVLVTLFEEKVFALLNKRSHRVWPKIRRFVCIVLAFAVVFLLLALILFFIIPEFVGSLKVFTDNLPLYVRQLSDWLIGLLKKLDVTQEQINRLQIDWSKIIERLTQTTTDFLTSAFSITMSVVSAVISFVMSVIFSIYMLFNKEKLNRNLRRLMYAFLPRARARKVIRVASLANLIFSGFIRGQLTEAMIIGGLCYLGMTLLNFPYALLISVIISITSVIPILGAYLGGMLGAFILLMIDPIYSLWFLVFLVLLQQFEGNVIYPRVVGVSIGLPGIWVLLAILVCGNMFGIPGILLGVPAFSVIYALLKEETYTRLRERNITEQEIMETPPFFFKGERKAAAKPPQALAPVPEESAKQQKENT